MASYSQYDPSQLYYDSQRGWVGKNADGSVSTVDEGTDPLAFGGSGLASYQAASGLNKTGQDNLNLYSSFATNQQNQQGQYASNVVDLSKQAFASGQDTTAQLGGIQSQAQQVARATTVDGRLGNSYDALSSYASRGPGPSAAEAQLQQASGQNIAAQFALANSGRNAGANAMATRQAAATAADIGQKTASDMASLRANEEANWRQQKLSALGAAGGVAGNIENAQQTRLGLQQSGISQLGALQNQSWTQGAANYNGLTSAQQTAAGITSAANGASLASLQAGTNSQAQYKQSALDIYSGNTNRTASGIAQDKQISASANAAGALADERNTDRLVGGLGSAAATAATVYSGS